MQPGERIGSYVVEQRLGAGQMGVVYAVRHAELGARYALKVLRRELCTPRDLLRFQREVQHLAAVSTHPRVVPIHTAGEDRGALYYVMDLIEGPTLQDLLARGGAMPPALAVRYVRDVADALTALHRAGIVHRDIKPANVLIDERLDVARLADFGLARSFLDPKNRLTVTGELVGTPHFMAPEQARGESAGPPADVYALGMVLFTLLAGRTAVSGKGLVDVLTRVGSGELERLPTLAPDTPEPLVTLIEACLQRDPAQRPEARALRDQLDAFLRAGAGARRPAAPRARVALVGGLALAAVGGLGAVPLLARRDQEPPATGTAPVHTAAPPPALPTPAPEAPPAAPWLDALVASGGSLDALREALRRVDALGPERLARDQRERLLRTVERAWDRWTDPFATRPMDAPLQADDVEAAQREIERFILLHALWRRVDPAHGLPDEPDLRLVVPRLGRWIEAVSPTVLAELVELAPSNINGYLLYVDGNESPFEPDAGAVDRDIFRRGMRLARETENAGAWGQLACTLANYLWSDMRFAERRAAATEELRALAAEAERLEQEAAPHGWNPVAAARTISFLQMVLLPWHPPAWPLLPEADRAEALAWARRAAALAPDDPHTLGHLAGALAAMHDDIRSPGFAEARQTATRFFTLNASAPDESLTTHVAVALCAALERHGDDAAAVAVCTEALASCTRRPLLAVGARRVLLLCRMGAAPDEVVPAMRELATRLATWLATRAEDHLGAQGVPELIARLEELASDLEAGRTTAAHVAENLQPLLLAGNQTQAFPLPRAE